MDNLGGGAVCALHFSEVKIKFEIEKLPLTFYFDYVKVCGVCRFIKSAGWDCVYIMLDRPVLDKIQ
jgi:hypothetical protein